jgi:hypothetical protein
MSLQSSAAILSHITSFSARIRSDDPRKIRRTDFGRSHTDDHIEWIILHYITMHCTMHCISLHTLLCTASHLTRNSQQRSTREIHFCGETHSARLGFRWTLRFSWSAAIENIAITMRRTRLIMIYRTTNARELARYSQLSQAREISSQWFKSATDIKAAQFWIDRIDRDRWNYENCEWVNDG